MGSVASVGPGDSTRTARYESVKVGRRHGHRLEMLLELLRAWGDMAHVVKGMCERQIGYSSLEREICLAGLNKGDCNDCVTQNMGASTRVYSLLCSCRHSSCFSATNAVELEYNSA
jgi:hypothetical protein